MATKIPVKRSEVKRFAHAVSAWRIKAEGMTSGAVVQTPTGLRAKIGDYLVTDERGERVVPQDVFEAHYQAIDEDGVPVIEVENE
jgi:hypothetical protein